MNNWIRKTNTIALMVALFAGAVLPNAIGQDADPTQAVEVSSGDDTVRILWRAEKLVSVLHYLEILTERSVIRPQSLPTPEFTFDSRGDMTRDEAILAIESLLSINGIGVTPMGEKFLKVIAIATITTEAPELVVGSLKDWPPSGKVVSKLFRLEYLDLQTFQTQVQQFLSPQFSKVIPFQNSNAVIVTDTISNLQRLEYVVSEVDKPSRLNVETRFYTLEFAQASEVAQQIQGLIDAARSNFGETNSQNSNTNNNRNQARTQRVDSDQPVRTLPVIPLASAEGSIPNQILFGSNTALASDDRTNQIIIMSEPSNMVFFDDIIEKLDIKSDPATRIEVIVLNHAEATEVAGLLSSFVSGSTSTESGDRSQAGANTGRQQNAGGQQTANQTANRQTAQTQPRQQQVSNAVRNTLEDRDSQFSDFMTIEADERSNALIISGTRSDLELMTELIAKIDVLLPQVLIEVIIAEVNLGNNADRGMNSISGTYIQNEEAGAANITGLNGLDLFGIGASNISLNLDKTTGVISNLSFDAILNAARTNSNVRILSKPFLMTTHNQEATFTVGQQVPIVTGTVSDSLNGNRETVQYQDIAIELKVKPLIGPNGIIQLEIDQSVNDIDGEVLVNGNPQPIIGRRQMVSFVSVKSNGLVVLGGMQRSKESKSQERMAILGEIPLLGNLFRSRGVEYENRELLLFIRPKVIRDADEADSDARETIGNHPISEKVDDLLDDGHFDLRTKDKKKSKSDDDESGSVTRKGFRK